jgi:hypothetical protein
MKDEVRVYLAAIGRRGGKRSRRSLDSSCARDMVRVREARRAFRKYFAECFWFSDPSLTITKEDVSWVAEQLLKHGSLECWKKGKQLCL